MTTATPYSKSSCRPTSANRLTQNQKRVARNGSPFLLDEVRSTRLELIKQREKLLPPRSSDGDLGAIVHDHVASIVSDKTLDFIEIHKIAVVNAVKFLWGKCFFEFLEVLASKCLPPLVR